MSYRPTAETHHGPTCANCADWAHGYASGHADGYSQGYAAAAGQGPAHPAVADSVSRMFGPSWDGPDAAAARSRARFHAWHATAHGGEGATA